MSYVAHGPLTSVIYHYIKWNDLSHNESITEQSRASDEFITCMTSLPRLDDVHLRVRIHCTCKLYNSTSVTSCYKRYSTHMECKPLRCLQPYDHTVSVKQTTFSLQCILINSTYMYISILWYHYKQEQCLYKSINYTLCQSRDPLFWRVHRMANLSKHNKM